MEKLLEKSIRFFVVFVVLCFFASSAMAQASSKNTLTLHGQLFDIAGEPAVGAHSIKVTINNASTGGSALFEEEHDVTVLSEGSYTVIIGDGVMPGTSVNTNGIPASVFASDNWYLGIKVDTDNEMTPRIRITSAPYAISAGDLSGFVASDFVTKTELAGEGFLKTETDPVYIAAPAASITNSGSGLVTTGTERTNWDAAYSWGDHRLAGYLTSASALNADNITTGTISAARIPGLDASKIVSGTLAVGRIPNLDASKITTGTFNNARINWASPSAIGSTTPSTGAFTTLDVRSYIYNNGSSYGGDVAFSDDLVPRTNGFYNLGTSSTRWGRLHVNGIYLNGALRTSWPTGNIITGNGSNGRLALWNSGSDITYNTSINYSGSSIACGTSATSAYKVYGYYNSSNYGYLGSSSTGVYGQSSTYGVYGNGSFGVYGAGGSYGIYGRGSYGVYGNGTTYGIYGTGGVYAGYFSGNVRVTGSISKGGGWFLIDHPLDPENKTLRHSFVESPEDLCMYRGTVTIGQNGDAVVQMPDYFKALTMENEATVTLTSIGKPFLVGYDWNENYSEFTVYGDSGRKVSYIVLADRDDPVMHKLRKDVVEEKGNGNFEKGTLLYPEAFGYPKEKGYDYQMEEQNKPSSVNESSATDKPTNN
ncbi:MAG: hypothetical protein K8S87_05320 [Planctomycetes bacterium]|nr:hypothetical protein [Planctomycetota bacterium]